MYIRKMLDNTKIFPRQFKKGEFYFVQIISRKKDFPENKEITKSQKLFGLYSIYTKQDFDKLRPKIKEKALKHNARVYMRPARRNKEYIAKLMMLLLSEHILENKHSLENLYITACGKANSTERKYIIDIDNTSKNELNKSIDILENRGKTTGNILDYYVLPTPNGRHIVSSPFDVRIFEGMYDIHKNNPIVLFSSINNHDDQ